MEEPSRLFLSTGLEKLNDPPASRELENRAVGHRVVEAPQLEQEPFHSRDIPDVGQRLAEDVDRRVVALSELSPAEDEVLSRVDGAIVE
jgi:hypothetical protein